MGFTRQGKLSGVRAKIERAKKHIRDLEAEIDAGFSRQKNLEGFRVKDDSDTGEKVYEVRLQNVGGGHLALVLGDAVHNLRSALDHLAYRLVISNGQTPTRNTSYPICEKPAGYKSKATERKIEGIDTSLFPLIEATQPYNAGYDGLGFLGELDNFDKHRMLIVSMTQTGPLLGMTVGGTASMPERRTAEGQLVVLNLPIKTMPFKNGEEYCRIRPGDLSNHDRSFVLSVQVAFSEPASLQRRTIFPLLPQLTQLVERVVQTFYQFV